MEAACRESRRGSVGAEADGGGGGAGVRIRPWGSPSVRNKAVVTGRKAEVMREREIGKQ